MSADTFVREARDGLQTLSDGLVELEQSEDRETIDDLFRTAHSLKSSFAMEGYDRASDLAHALEDVLDAMRAGQLSPSETAVDELLDAADVLGTMLNEVERNGRTRTDPAHSVDKLRQVIEGVPSPDSPATERGGGPETGSADGADVDGADVDEAVEAALDAASEFDDLDARVAQMDDPAESGTLEGGGSFDDLFDDSADERDSESPDLIDVPDTAASETPAETRQESTASTDDRFLAAKSSVDEDTPISELQEEIAAESFGEFDDEDTLSIQELVSMEPEASEPDSPTDDAGTDDAGTDETAALRDVVDALGEDTDSDDGVEHTAASAEFERVAAETGDSEPTVQQPTQSESADSLPAVDTASTADDEDGVAAFGADAGMADFESRFDSLFDSDEDAAGRGHAAATIEESALQTDRYRHTDRTPSPTETTDGVQSLTVGVEYADDLLSLVEDLSVNTQQLTEQTDSPEAAETAESVAASVRDLQRTVMEIRLMPVETVTGQLDRVVRDVSRETGTEVDLQVEGAGTRVDRSIIDRLGDPLVHLVRNAVDHGIEPPTERETAGKPPTGTVTVSVRRSGDEVVIEVTDDGRGVDPDAARTAAVDAGVMSRAEAAALSDSEACDLIWHPGLSTADSVTRTSGRGVGMDAVKRAVDALNGRLSVESDRGTGTTVRLRLPVTMAVSEVLLVAADGREFAIPAADVQRVGPAGEARFADSLSATDTDRTIDLAAAMDGETVGEDPAVLTVDTDDGPLTVECDRVIERREVVVSPYDDLLAGIPGLSGATTGTSGQLAHVVDVDEL